MRVLEFKAILIVSIIFFTACNNNPSKGYDYSAFKKHKPRSILIIPPKNNSLDVNAPYVYLSTLTRPLAEKGYYIFPVHLIDSFLKANGLTGPEEMNNIPLDKIAEHIGADAVLYITIKEWGQKFKVLSSATVIKANLRLVDVKTGTTLWSATANYYRSSDSAQGGLANALINAVITQIIASQYKDKMLNASREATYPVINSEDRGLLDGPYKIVKTN